MRARLVTINRDYCFAILADTQERIYVHQDNCSFPITDCLLGDIINIGLLTDHSLGRRGHRVIFLERPGEPLTGTVEYLNMDKGWGFLRADGTKHNVMFHVSAFQDAETFHQLAIGDRVTGIVQETERGWRAEMLALV